MFSVRRLINSDMIIISYKKGGVYIFLYRDRDTLLGGTKVDKSYSKYQAFIVITLMQIIMCNNIERSADPSLLYSNSWQYLIGVS